MARRGPRQLDHERIQQAGWHLMSQHGTAGLTLRGIARQLEVTAPAIYNYYPRLEDLITAMITSAFTRLAESIEAADRQAAGADLYARIVAMCLAYRGWAMEHPVEFQLIYGNPIPGYEAPPSVTVPLARRPFLGLFHCFQAANQVGELQVPVEYQRVPPSVAQAIEAWRQESGMEMTAPLVGLMMSGWARMHGMVMLELFHHIQPLVGPGGDFYRFELEAMLQHLGLRPGAPSEGRA